MILLSLLCALMGFAALCLAMPRHQRDLLGRALASGLSRTLKACGWITLALAMVFAMRAEGAALGAVYAVGIYTLCALAVSMGVTFLSRR